MASFFVAVARKAQSKKIRIQLVVDESINQLLNQLAERERRTKSAVVEVALLDYAKRSSAAPEARG